MSSKLSFVRFFIFSSFLVNPALADNYYNSYGLAPSYAAAAVASSMSSSSSSSSSSLSSMSSSSVYEDDYTDDEVISSASSVSSSSESFFSSSSLASAAAATSGDVDDGSSGWSYRYCLVDSDGNEFDCSCSYCNATGNCSSGGC